MKKSVTLLLIVSTLLLLVGCGNRNAGKTVNMSKNFETVQSGNIILPKVKEDTSQNAADLFSKIRMGGFFAVESLAQEYYGYKPSFSNGNDIYGFYDPTKNSFVATNEPSSVKNWTLSSGSTVVLQNRYYYEWRCYNDYDDGYNVKLIQIDINNKSSKVIDEIKSATPFIYQYKISETEILSYSLTQAESQKTDYAVISQAWIYNEKGEKRNIISERYENNASWSDSEGILIERFFISGGEIYGLGRKMISGEYKFFVYHYDKDGTLLEEKIIANFENIIGSEQFQELLFINDYLVFRTYETLTTYICKISDNKAELVMKGTDGKVQYAISGDYLLFIESNINPDNEEAESAEFPLYIIDTVKNEVHSVRFLTSMKNPRFVDFKSLSNGDLVISYCDNKEYDPLKTEQFVLSKSELYKAAEKWF